MGKPAGEPSRDKITVEAGFKPAWRGAVPYRSGSSPAKGMRASLPKPSCTLQSCTILTSRVTGEALV